MIRMLKWVIFGAVVCAMVGSFSTEAKAEKKIGVLLWTDAQLYSDAMNGIRDQLKKAGFGEPNAKYVIEHAEGSKVKAAALAEKFAAAKFDLVIVLGTSAAIAVSKEIKDTPIVFSMVYDPVEAQLVKDLKSSGNNITGASNKVSTSQMIKILKQLAPVNKLGALYQPNEKNSVSHLRDLQEAQKDAQIKVVPIPITEKEDLAQILPEAMRSVDAVYICGSSIIGEMIPTVADIATKAKKIAVTHTTDRVEKGVLLGVVADAYAVGLLSGEKAAKVLKGAKPSSIPIGTIKKPEVLLNMKTVKAGQFQIPPAFMKKVTKTIK